MRRSIIVSLIGTIIGLPILVVAAVLGAFHFYGRDLPDYKQLADYEPPIVTRVHAGDGLLLTEYSVEKRVFVPIEAIPKRVIHAFLSAEDKSFYSHPGIDVPSILRAIVTNIANLGSDRRPIGASTITQQVAKNFLLSSEVSITRKVKEAILAIRIEQAFSKDRILELYLNEIYLGLGSYGVAAAALNYFNKSLDQLTIGDAAFLAALPKAPNNYHPLRQQDAAEGRRNWVIGRMVEDGHITREQAEEARTESLVMRRRDPTEIVDAAYFAEEVRRDLIRMYGEDNLYQGGLSVRTTLNPRLQAIADRALLDGLIAYDRRHGWRGPVARLDGLEEDWADQLRVLQAPVGIDKWRLAIVLGLSETRAEIGFEDGERGSIPMAALAWARPWLKGQKVGPKPARPSDVLAVGDVVLVEHLTNSGEDERDDIYGLRQTPEVNGALVALDPHTGRVLAMSGGFSYEQSEFNRATQALRQPGSAFKPFVYLAALDNGFTPASIILDAPLVIDQGRGLGRWKPTNYTERFYGPAPMRVGIEKSRNLMTVRLAQSVGMQKVVDYARRFGVVDRMPPTLSMALGAGETTLLRLTTAYAMFVNGGKEIAPTLIDRIQDRHGATIFRHDSRACEGCRADFWLGQEVPEVPDGREQIASPASVYQIVSMLQGVVERGTGRRVQSVGKPIAGKTGTTNDSVDAWFIGFSPDLVAGVYVGFDVPRPLGENETGSSAAAPIFASFMKGALEGKPAVPFRIPPGISLVRIDAGTGQLAQAGDGNIILEAFKTGSGPNGESLPLSRDLVPAGSGSPVGTGGLY